MFYKLLPLALFVAFVHAQGTDTTTTPASTASPSTCLLACLQSSTVCTYTDVSCVCTNTEYQTAVSSCVKANCTAADATAATAYQDQLCPASSSGTDSSTSSGTESSTSSGTKSSTSSGVPSTSTGTSSNGTSTKASGTNSTKVPTSTATAKSGAVGMVYGGNGLLQTVGVMTLGALGAVFLVL